MPLEGMLLPKKDATLPQDPLFSKLLKLATQRGDQIIVDDCSRGVRFGYRHILHGTVTLQQQLQCLLDSSILENRGGFFVALLAPNGYEFIVGTLAVLALGGVVVPMREYSPFSPKKKKKKKVPAKLTADTKQRQAHFQPNYPICCSSAEHAISSTARSKSSSQHRSGTKPRSLRSRSKATSMMPPTAISFH